jgi:cytochrome c553
MNRESATVKRVGTLLAVVSLLVLLSIAARGQKTQAAEVSAILAKCQQCHGATVQMSKVLLGHKTSDQFSGARPGVS